MGGEGQARAAEWRPLPPAVVEAIRGQLHQRDAALVSLLAYAGLRPGEALALTWGDVRENTAVVDKAVAHGEVKDTKTRRTRTVRLLRPLAADHLEWRLASGRRDLSEPIFPLGRGGFWTETAYRNWRRLIFNPPPSASESSIRAHTICATASRPFCSQKG
jgi:integrase